MKVAVVATGGLSHQVHGERAGFNNTKWDLEFKELLEKDPESLINITAAECARRGGWEGGEVIMWLVMRAMASKVRKLHPPDEGSIFAACPPHPALRATLSR